MGGEGHTDFDQVLNKLELGNVWLIALGEAKV